MSGSRKRLSTSKIATSSADGFLTETRNSGLVKWVFLYGVTGIFQPMMIDYIRYNGGIIEWPPTLLPLLANTLGMAIVSKLVKGFNISLPRKRKDSEVFYLLPWGQQEKILYAASLDFGSAACTITGLLFVGSGMFTIVYSSTTAWTAILSWFYGKNLHQGQWIGIFFVTFGLALNGYGIIDDFDTSGSHLIIGCMILLAGTILHSGSFVYNEAQITPNSVDTSNTGHLMSPFLCSVMGQLEAVFLLFWNIILSVIFGAKQLYSITPMVFLCYTCLVFSNAIHALAFFAMLGQLGAVSTGVLKGILSVCIMAFSSLCFCQYESHQCLTPMKAISLIVTLFGSLTFILATAEKKNSIRTQEIHS